MNYMPNLRELIEQEKQLASNVSKASFNFAKKTPVTGGVLHEIYEEKLAAAQYRDARLKHMDVLRVLKEPLKNLYEQYTQAFGELREDFCEGLVPPEGLSSQVLDWDSLKLKAIVDENNGFTTLVLKESFEVGSLIYEVKLPTKYLNEHGHELLKKDISLINEKIDKLRQ